MTRRRLSLFTIPLVALLAHLAPVASVHAYQFYLTTGGDPLRWKRTLAEYRLATVMPGEMTLEEVESAFDRAIAAWDGSACTPEVVRAGRVDATEGAVPASVRGPPDNIIVFIPDTTHWATLKHGRLEIAVTVIANNPETGEIVDADIEVNDGGFEFSISEAPIAGRIDFHSTITHELGLVFGLDHSGAADATMFASYDAGDPAAKRTLAQDDIDGVCALYAIPFPDPPDDDCAGAGAPGTSVLIFSAFVILARRRRGQPGFAGPSGGGRRAYAALATLIGMGVLLTHAPATQAFEFTFPTGGGPEPARWKLDGITYRMATVMPEDLTLEEVEAAFDRAVAPWIDTGCVPDVTRNGRAALTDSTMPKTVDEPPDNVLVFIQDANTWLRKGPDRSRLQIAVTLQIFDKTTGAMIDADIEVNDVDFEFSVEPTTPPGSVDFQATLTHELGHVFGLDHSLISDATMYKDYSTRGDPASKRSLHQDDIDGVCALAALPFPEPKKREDDGCSVGPSSGFTTAFTVLFGAALRHGARARRRERETS